MIQQSPTEERADVARLNEALKIRGVLFDTVFGYTGVGDDCAERTASAIEDALEQAGFEIIASQAAQPAEADECPSCGGLNISCPDGCGRDPETGELNGTRLQPEHRAELAIRHAATPKAPTSTAGEVDDIGKGNHDCLAKRRPGEPMFILLGRDPDAWQIVRMWATRRLNAGGDPEHCTQGLRTANAMREYAADPANRPASAPEPEAYAALATPPAPNDDLRAAFGALLTAVDVWQLDPTPENEQAILDARGALAQAPR